MRMILMLWIGLLKLFGVKQVINSVCVRNKCVNGLFIIHLVAKINKLCLKLFKDEIKGEKIGIKTIQRRPR